jgi:DNA-directed RNA polymerase specialized sigma24 family protein
MNAAASRLSVDTGAVAFVTTHWSVVLAAQGPSPAAEEALEKLCRSYWRPIYGFVRRQGSSVEEAQDLTQGFFALLLERRDFDAVRREKGRLRSYLLVSVKHFLANEHHRAMAIKRGEGRPLIPFDEEITTAMSGRTCRGVFRHSRKLKKKTARAGFISASTGHSTRPKASCRAAMWPIMSSITPSLHYIPESGARVARLVFHQ